ncbi:hypothetical protein AB6A40_011209 [Gnathostoma spinigerum]|uniref:C2H2-type domain-containing protein n=1 Tax=Gnathostoma spinigerum TaxID=75299 RepID=A0ABD6EX28_9BILA
MPATPPPQKRRRSTITSQNLMASSPEAHKTVKLDCVGGKTDPVSILADCEPVSSSMTTEDLLVSLSNANSQLPFDLSKAEAALQLWTRENNGSSEGAENQSHSPSVDSDTSGSTAVDPETGDKEPMICTHCGIMFSDPTLHLLHKGLHSALDPWTCNLCGHSCGDKYLFHAHMICFDHSCC